MEGILLPGFTILIPTLNSERRIARCLDSIRSQDFPQDRIQIIIADGGSTDNTREIALGYGATIVDNPLRLAEEGLRIGMSRVKRELVTIFADDNELAQPDWLSTVWNIFSSDLEICAFFCRLAASRDDSPVNKYYALVESEPLSFYMNRNTKYYIDHSPAGRSGRVTFNAFDVEPGRPLVWGANGLTYRTRLIRSVWRTEEYLGDTDAFQIMTEEGHRRVAYTRELCVYHHHVDSLASWRAKWERNFQQHFLNNIGTRNLNWLFVPHFSSRLVAWTVYSLIPVASVPVSLVRVLRDRDWHWLYHPAAAFLQAATYIKIVLSTGPGREFLAGWMRRVVRRRSPVAQDRSLSEKVKPLEDACLKGDLLRFRIVADEMAGDDPNVSMDWRSALWLHGTRRCVETVAGCLPCGSRVLDYGCGLGLVPCLLRAEGFEVKGIDIDAGGQPDTVEEAFCAPWASLEAERADPGLMKNMWARLTEEFGVDFEAYDGDRIPAPDGAFDAVVAHGVIEHVNPGLLPASFSEIRRVLAPGGLFFIFRTPRKKAYLEKLAALMGMGTHEMTYDEREVEAMVQAAGFQTVRIDYSDMLPSFLPAGMNLYNRVAGVTARIDEWLLGTTLRRYAHHMSLIFKRA